MERTEAAYAKLNLYLDVTAKRPDGFHDLKSVMHTVTLADTVTVNAKIKACDDGDGGGQQNRRKGRQKSRSHGGNRRRKRLQEAFEKIRHGLVEAFAKCKKALLCSDAAQKRDF